MRDEFNDQNRLSRVTLNTVEQATYRYNFAGHQVVRSVWTGGVLAKTISVHDIAGMRLGEYDGATGTLLREYLWLGDRPLAVLEGGQLYHLHLNQVGRPDMATDAAGNVVWQASFYPFGGIHQVTIDTGALTQNLRFPGQWFQAETGLHQNWHRDYDPTLGRYLQADPLGLVDGPSVYGYALQSPMAYIDPKGGRARGGTRGGLGGRYDEWRAGTRPRPGWDPFGQQPPANRNEPPSAPREEDNSCYPDQCRLISEVDAETMFTRHLWDRKYVQGGKVCLSLPRWERDLELKCEKLSTLGNIIPAQKEYLALIHCP